MKKLYGVVELLVNNKSSRLLTPYAGGELGKKLFKLRERVLECSCKQSFILREFVGYPRQNGLKDVEGKAWWVFALCPYCNRRWSCRDLDYKKLRKANSRPRLRWF